MSSSPRSLKIQLARCIGELDRFRRDVAEFYRIRGIDESVVPALELSAYEAAANIVEHDDPAYQETPITVELILSDREAEIIMTYRGEMFDVAHAPLPDVEAHYRSGKKRGLGIYFIRKLMDRVEYSHENMTSTLKMVKNIITR
jgi:serine/threonine-protein kinase RsbW